MTIIKYPNMGATCLDEKQKEQEKREDEKYEHHCKAVEEIAIALGLTMQDVLDGNF